MITAKQARELTNTSEVQLTVIMMDLEAKIKESATKGKTELTLSEGVGATRCGLEERPQATTTMIAIKLRLEDLGFKVSFVEKTIRDNFFPTLPRILCTVISW